MRQRAAAARPSNPQAEEPDVGAHGNRPLLLRRRARRRFRRHRHAGSARGRAGTRDRSHRVLRGHQPDRPSAPEGAPLVPSPRADQGPGHVGRARCAGRRPGADPRGCAEQLVHDSQADRHRARRRAGAPRGPRPLQGRADLRGGGLERAGRPERRGQDQRGTRSARVSTGGRPSDDAPLRNGATAESLHLRGHHSGNRSRRDPAFASGTTCANGDNSRRPEHAPPRPRVASRPAARWQDADP